MLWASELLHVSFSTRVSRVMAEDSRGIHGMVAEHVYRRSCFNIPLSI